MSLNFNLRYMLKLPNLIIRQKIKRGSNNFRNNLKQKKGFVTVDYSFPSQNNVEFDSFLSNLNSF